MVKVQIGVLNQRFGYIDPSRLKCLSCGEEFYYPYCNWAGGIMVVLCCPGCKKPISEYVNYTSPSYIWLPNSQNLFPNFPEEVEQNTYNGY